MITGHSFLLDKISATPWMVRPEFLQTMQSILESKFIDKVDFKELMRVPAEPKNEYNGINYEVYGRDLVINIDGTMIPQGSQLDALCGFVSMSGLRSLVRDARDDSSIERVVYVWDCPGSTVQGAFETLEEFKALASEKHVISLCTGLMCSGAYLLGSSADEIYSTSRTNEVGSIGVLSLHVDQSRMDEARGLKFTYLTAGRYKAAGNEHEPLSEDIKNELMKNINYSYDLFKETVKENRNLTDDELNAVVEGRVFKAGLAVENKLIDGIMSLEQILN